MTEHVFKAADSDSAMEKAIRELGEDAMILSVIRKGDVTEVRAIKESLASVSPRTPPPFPKGAKSKPVSLSDALRSAENKRLGVAPQPNMVDRPALDFFFGDDPFIAPAGSHPKETKPNRQTQEPKDNIPADVERLFDETLSTRIYQRPIRLNPKSPLKKSLKFLCHPKPKNHRWFLSPNHCQIFMGRAFSAKMALAPRLFKIASREAISWILKAN
jgi:flagellar biosynthesis GTPase FlhF